MTRDKPCRAQFNYSAYRKHRIDANGSREFCAYAKRISWVSGVFGLLRVGTPVHVTRHSTLTRLAQKFSLAREPGIVILSAEFGGKQSHEIGPRWLYRPRLGADFTNKIDLHCKSIVFALV